MNIDTAKQLLLEKLRSSFTFDIQEVFDLYPEDTGIIWNAAMVLAEDKFLKLIYYKLNNIVKLMVINTKAKKLSKDGIFVPGDYVR